MAWSWIELFVPSWCFTQLGWFILFGNNFNGSCRVTTMWHSTCMAWVEASFDSLTVIPPHLSDIYWFHHIFSHHSYMMGHSIFWCGPPHSKHHNGMVNKDRLVLYDGMLSCITWQYVFFYLHVGCGGCLLPFKPTSRLLGLFGLNQHGLVRVWSFLQIGQVVVVIVVG